MTDAYEIETAEEFREALESLVRSAEANGVDVAGSWQLADGTGNGWDVILTELDASRQ